MARDLGAAHGDRQLFSGLELAVSPGDVVGLVGANGAGKSTLLRLLAGIDRPEQGSVQLSPAGSSVGYLPQEPDRYPGETIATFLARRTGVAAVQATLDAATEALADTSGTAAEQDARNDAYSDALELWLALGAADLDERSVQVAAEIGLDAQLETPMTALSGGQAARAGLASLLLSRYDIFLLD